MRIDRATDSHCHLDFPVFDEDRDAVLQRAYDAGICRFLVPGVARKSWPRLLALVTQYSSWHFALGLHPYFIEQHEHADIQALEHEIDKIDSSLSARFFGIGEIGLDATCADLAKQKRLLQAQLQVAGDRNLPVILHHRKTLDIMVPMVKQAGVTHGIVHAFSGSLQQAEQWIELGFKLGVGGVITYDRAKKTRHAIANVPGSAIVFETDSPDMPVNGYQGKRNEPVRMKSVLAAYDELKK